MATGLGALAMLGLHELDSDRRIRDAIEIMMMRSHGDPIGRSREALEGVDLRKFFRHVAARGLNLSTTSVDDALRSRRDGG